MLMSLQPLNRVLRMLSASGLPITEPSWISRQLKALLYEEKQSPWCFTPSVPECPASVQVQGAANGAFVFLEAPSALSSILLLDIMAHFPPVLKHC